MIPLGVLASARVETGDPISAAILADSPVSFWPLAGTSQDVVWGQPMTDVQGEVVWVNDPVYGLVANTTNGAMSRQNGPRLPQAAYSYDWLGKVSAVPTGKPEVVAFADWGGVAQGAMVLFESNGRPRIYHRQNYQLATPAASYLTTTWAHYAVTWDGADVRYFKNGTLYHTWTTNIVPQTASALVIGSYAALASPYINGGGRWPGLLSRVAMYSTALSPARILAHAQAAGVA